MSRDSLGFRSWFQRAMLLGPSTNKTIFRNAAEDDDDDEDVERIDNPSHNIVNGNVSKWHGGETIKTPDICNNGMSQSLDMPFRGRRDDLYTEWYMLQEDNVRLWDCLGMLRTDPTMTSHTAIHIVTQAPNSDYFPKDVRAGFKHFFKDENQLAVEVLRLSVENQKLHAVLWVLADNPVIRVDSVLAAVFRLNDEQFGEKFKFEYRPGCFSDKGMVMGHGGRDDKSTSIMSNGKRCRSSTPIRSFKTSRNVSERISQSVSRRGNVRTGGQNNSSNRRCRMEKIEPSRKHPDIWMMSALLAELDDTSSKNALFKMLKNQAELYNRESDVEVNEDNDENKSDGKPQLNDCIQLSHRPAKDQLTTSSSMRSKQRSFSRGKAQLRFNVQDINLDDSTNYSNNCTGSLKNINKNHSQGDFFQKDNLNFASSKFYLEKNVSKQVHTVSHHTNDNLIPSQKSSKRSKYSHMDPSWRRSTISDVSIIQSVNRGTNLIPLKVSKPYRIDMDLMPADFILRQAHIKETMCQNVRKTNLYYNPKGRLELARKLLPKMYDDLPFYPRRQLPSRCCEGHQWKIEKTRCFYNNIPVPCINGGAKKSVVIGNEYFRQIPGYSKSEYSVKDIKPRSVSIISLSLKKSIQDPRHKDNSKQHSKESIQRSEGKRNTSKGIQCPGTQGTLRGCSKPDDRCLLLKKGLPLLGKKQYTKPIQDMVNRSCHYLYQL